MKCLALAALSLLLFANGAAATPSRIIILRHGEKADPWRLCNVGQQRADALAAEYLGRDAKQSLFGEGEQPAAFIGITLHTLELAAPAASTWKKPVILYPALPEAGNKAERGRSFNKRTEQAATDVMTDPAYAGKIVVMVWEHKHIANAKLDEASKTPVTLRKLLKLDALSGVPDSWPSDNYDYFWIVDYKDGSDVPSNFTMIKQEFSAPYDKLPSNDWGKPGKLKPASGCDVH